MYFIANRMLYCAGSIKIGFRFDDRSIQRKLVSLSVPYRVVVYGTSIAVMVLICLLDNFFAVKRVDNLYQKFIFGWLCIANINMFVKSFVGRLRPNFLSMNKVDKDIILPEGFSEEHVLPEAKSPMDKLYAMESRKSFFSGHSAMGVYAGVFLCIYTWEALSRSPAVMAFQVVFLMTGMYPGLTQWRNYWHHWDDVAVGYFLGTLSAFMAYNYTIVGETDLPQ
jgi:membrane-associated phospholipid phosphatase